MALLLRVPSLKRMAAVRVCGNLLKNERPIRAFIDIENTDFHDWEKERRMTLMRVGLKKNLSLCGLPVSLEKELYPLIGQMTNNLGRFFNIYREIFDEKDLSFVFKFLSQVQFRNRGHVDTFATIRRHLQEDGAMRNKEPGDIFTWACAIGDPVAIKAELNRNREQIYASLDDESGLKIFWMRHVGENPLELERFKTIPIATARMVLDGIISDAFQQGIDFVFSLLTKVEKLSHVEENESASDISPTEYGRLILQLETPQDREAFYRQHGYGILLRIVLRWEYHDLFKDAVVELVDFLSADRYWEVANELADFVESSIHPYKQTAGDMFLFFWQTSSEDLRSHFIQSHLDDGALSDCLRSLSIEATVTRKPRCFAAVVDDVKRLGVLRSFLLSEHGSTLCLSLIMRRLFKCLKQFLSHVSVAELVRKHENVLEEICMDFDELYFAIHMDCQ